jgi:hypothetical protein
MTGLKVSLDPEHIIQDFVGLGHEVYDLGDLAVIVDPPRPVGKR